MINHDALEAYRVREGKKLDLSQHDPEDRALYKGSKKDGKDLGDELNERLEHLQELMYAEGKRKLLVVLQAMDTAGKDSTIRRVFEHVNPQGVKVAKFGKPTEKELSHDYLWRVHPHTPAKGEIMIYNRSHYEDVLVVRVHDIVPEQVWSRRYEHIRNFEQLLVDEGTGVVKFFLNISFEEQRKRLQDRLDEHHKHWKFRKGDLAERKLWPVYMEAYEAALSRTSTESAPWYVIPADDRWYRDLAILSILVEKLESFDMSYPAAEEGLEGLVVE